VTAQTAAFVEFLVRADVLTFGDFTTKSGRATPYFLNFGRVRTGSQVAALGRFYADRVVEVFGRDVDVLFGPAYKGIPLAVATAIALAEHHDLDVAWCFDRKEAKDHGEGGRLVGHAPRDGDRVVVVEDVTTAGTSIRQTVPLLRAAADVDLRGLVVSVDRAERGTGDTSALAEIADEFGMTTTAITDIDAVVAHLRDHDVDGRRVVGPEDLERVAAYRRAWGA
jgi:orotate phosphoribosyltransferase